MKWLEIHLLGELKTDDSAHKGSLVAKLFSWQYYDDSVVKDMAKRL